MRRARPLWTDDAEADAVRGDADDRDDDRDCDRDDDRDIKDEDDHEDAPSGRVNRRNRP